MAFSWPWHGFMPSVQISFVSVVNSSFVCAVRQGRNLNAMKRMDFIKKRKDHYLFITNNITDELYNILSMKLAILSMLCVFI
jgi:hypothetical protein